MTNLYTNDRLINRFELYTMKIKIELNHDFQPFAGNLEFIEVKGDSVKECLDNLIGRFPVFKKLLYDENDALCALVLLDSDTIIMSDPGRPITKKASWCFCL